ncbi:MAG: squalene/phytoene synthase family protein [Alphaproteobacteria bacterium]|nr:squalene/phytoene synthase family protein [Alphaproteobacteria bacterium]
MERVVALKACAETVRRHDANRYLSALFAPADRRPLLFALYAFNYEIARVGEVAHEPMIGAIRLEWWREVAEGARDGLPRTHSAAIGLAELFARCAVPLDLFEALVSAREQDAASESFATLEALEAYADATSGGLMRIAARVLGAGDTLDRHARTLGIAYALAGLARAIPFHAMRGKLSLPLDMVRAEGLSREDVFAGRGRGGLKRVIAALAERAREHLAAARALPKAGRGLPALLPAATTRGYLKLLTRPDFDPFVTLGETPLPHRQLAIFGAALRGRV